MLIYNKIKDYTIKQGQGCRILKNKEIRKLKKKLFVFTQALV